MKQAENFRNFLVKHEAYDNFCVEIFKLRRATFKKLTEKRINFSGIIDGSLQWAGTDQGQEYWANLNRLWNKACRNCTKFRGEYRSIW